MKKRILAVLTAPAIIALPTLPAASQADRATAIGRLHMAGLSDLDRNTSAVSSVRWRRKASSRALSTEFSAR